VNPYIIIAVAVVLAGGGAATGWKLHSWRDAAVEQSIEKAAKAAGEESDKRWGEKVATLRPIYTTVTKGVEKETIRETRYATCEHTDAAWSLLLDAYAAQDGQKPADPGVPAASAAR
jgi:hypothetical protein